MAMQEYANISDDLDNQVNAAYLKRNRSLAKPNQKKGAASRPGQKGVAPAPAGRGVSDGVRALMQKRKDWIEMVGPVVTYGRPPIPEDDETIFDEATMKRLEKAEKEAEAVEAEDP
jgi:transcriptional adapter 3